MKTFKTIGMACLAIAASINFTACGDDDDDQVKVEENLIKNEYGIITNQKRLVKAEATSDGDDETSIFAFSYDENGRLISASENFGSDFGSTRFTWGNGSISVAYNSNFNGTYSNTYTLADNLVRKQEYEGGNGYTLTYDSSDRLIKMNNNGYECYTFTWDNRQVTKILYERGKDAVLYEITYSKKTCNGWFPTNIIAEDLNYILWVHPELTGVRITQLPESSYIKFIEEGKTVYEQKSKLNYTFDKDGYVKNFNVEVTERDLEDNSTYTGNTLWTLTWE